MKVSDLMLDMATGDASIHDAYIQEAVGKINVSSAIFEAAYKISELPEGEEFLVVQEAAAAGLPTDPAGASACASEAVMQELKAFYDLMVETAKKIKQGAEKNIKLIMAIGKKYGVTAANGEDFEKSFAEPLSKAIADDKGKKLTLDEKRFLTAKYSERIVEAYGTGVSNFMSAYGLSFDNSTLNSNYASYKSKKGVNTFKDMQKNISYGVKQIDFDKAIDKNKHCTNRISASDIKEMIISLYEVTALSKAVIAVAGNASAKKTALNLATELCGKEDCDSKKVSRTLDNLNEDIKAGATKLASIADIITKAYTDSVYALTEALNGGAV